MQTPPGGADPLMDVKRSEGPRPGSVDVVAILQQLHVGRHHLFHQGLHVHLGRPPKLLLGLLGVADEDVDLGGAIVLGVDAYDNLSGCHVNADLIRAAALPLDLHVDAVKCPLNEVAHLRGDVGGDDKVVGLLLLQHQPHRLHVLLGVPPVALCVDVAHVQAVLHALLDAHNGARDLACDKCGASAWAFVVEKDAVGAVHVVRLAVVHHDPERVLLGHAVG
mmetsp:Transcript_28837/g.72564  ORF Transcript_28837/g.72564 Transcript_28837/m.72564 type:complete len:221 (+) Transcript_28837:37-699(+)